VDPIRMIRDKDDLESTCYIELLPGEYRGRCWNEGSVFFAEDVFGLFEPIIARHEPLYDHYSFVCIGRAAWELIVADLGRLAQRARRAHGVGDLGGEVGFLFIPTEEEFASNFSANADALASLAAELAGWLREQLMQHDCVSVLGM
jgi:hypothetical protein